MKALKTIIEKVLPKQMPKVSILVPCYNSRATLPATLRSIQKSKYRNLDVMIVDDGHEVRVNDIVESFKDSRFRYFYKENEGLGYTRNFGIRNALGEFIFFLDSDDVIYPDSIDNLVSYALEHDLDVVSGVTVRCEFESKTESEWFRRLYKTHSINTLENRLSLFDDTLSTNKLYRVELLKKHELFFETGLYEDKIFTAKLYSLVDRIGLIPNRVYVWYVYGEQTSITTSKTIKNFDGRMRAINMLWQYLPELRKAYQIAFFMNHDLLIYLREFKCYNQQEKEHIFQAAHDFIQRNRKYIYRRLVPNTLNSACLDALNKGQKETFIYLADILSNLFQEELRNKR